MQPGSVTVRVGETVKVGQLLGRVGNSGSTMVDGAFLIKGDTFRK
jgi:murein DD-endopeptidase MepM/ murein hydrolase activator NlpD